MERYDEHYVRSVTALGDQRPVVTSQAIFTRKGIKLVDKGVRVNSALYDRLVQHKLMPQLDQCLEVEDGVTQASLREQAKRMLETEPCFQRLAGALPGVERLLRAFYATPLNPPLAFKLTVAREQRPELFEHSLKMALVALYLGIKSRLTDQELAGLAAAAMFHDLGILHVTPELLQPGRRLLDAERSHLYAHPVTTYVILQEYSQYHPEISTPVLEHHERLDGSGYPRGLKGDEISFHGQILMLAEVVAKFVECRRDPENATRIAVVLKLNQRKFNRKLTEHLVSLMGGGQVPGPNGEEQEQEQVSAESVLAQLDQLGEVLRDWDGTHGQCAIDTPALAETPLLDFVHRRVGALERELAETGFDPNELAALTVGVENDAEALMELQLLAHESRWQLVEILQELRRRWQELAGKDEAGGEIVAGWLRRSEEILRG